MAEINPEHTPKEAQGITRDSKTTMPTSTGTKAKINHLALIPTFLDIWAATTTRSITSPFVRKKGGARTYRRDVMYAMLREILSGFEVHESQHLQPGTSKVYQRIAKSKKWKANSVDLEHGAQGHWLGHHDAKYVMVYFHGGGYISPASAGHLKYQFALQKYLRKQGIDISVFSLSYILAPHSVYPVQIQSALSALVYLIQETGRDPSTTLLGGDSAGGNLVAATLLHLGHPHPKVPALKLDKRLKGAVLISPWISFDTSSPSFKTNEKSDYLTVTALDRASSAFIGEGARHDEYSEPISAPVEWWREVSKKAVEEVLVWGGGGEVLIDGIQAFAGHLISGFRGAVEDRTAVVEERGNVEKTTMQQPKKERVKLVVSPNEAHEEMIIDYLLHIRKEEHGGKEIKKWLVEVLKEDFVESGHEKAEVKAERVHEMLSDEFHEAKEDIKEEQKLGTS